MTQAVNLRRSGYDIYCGRPGPWGNPFRIGPDGDRNAVIVKHKTHVRQRIRSGALTLEQLNSLYGKRLGCYCKPAPCHADFLAELADTAHAILELLSRFRDQGAGPDSQKRARLLSCQFLAAGAGSIRLNADGAMEFAKDETTEPIRLPATTPARDPAIAHAS